VNATNAEFDAALDGDALNVSGMLTFDTVPEALVRTAAWVAGAVAAVDLANVERADTAGLALMVEWLRLARAAGRTLRFVKIPDQVRAIIRVNGLSRAFDADRA